ncbi:MAG: Ig-like domain-containing protein, partial [Roseibacillus sp.]
VCSSDLQGGRTLRNGTIRWRRVVRDIVVGRANSRRQVDPIEYTVTDLETGEVHTGTLYSVLIEVNAGGGGFKWENDTVKIDALDLRFKAEFPSQFTSLKGELDLHVKNGKVTHSEATGHYAGVLPPVGSSVPLEFPLADDEEFDYDLGDFDGHDLDVNLEFSGAGEAEEERAADPQLTVTPGRPAGPTESVTLTWPPQNCPVVVQQSTNLNQWKDLSVDTPDLQNGLHVVTIPVEPDRETFFRLRTEESQIFDIDPPKFQAHAFCFEPVVMLAFTEAIDPVTARDPSLFLILDEAGQPNQIRDLQLVAPDTLLLFLEHPIQPTQSLKAVILDGVRDRAGNAMRPNYAVPVDCNDSRPSPPEGPRSPDGLHPPGDPALPVDP